MRGDCIEQFHINKFLNNENGLYSCLLNIINTIINKYNTPLGIGVAIHSLVDNNFNIPLAPNNNLNNIKIKHYLLEIFPNYKFYIESKANISALGESKRLNKKI